MILFFFFVFFFFNDTATTEIYTLSLHDALPIERGRWLIDPSLGVDERHLLHYTRTLDRKSTRLNSSHPSISDAAFCLKKKKKYNRHRPVATPAEQYTATDDRLTDK